MIGESATAPPRRCHATAGRPNIDCSAAIFAAAETVKPIQVVCAGDLAAGDPDRVAADSVAFRGTR